MRFIKISQTELQDIGSLYESVMSQACHGLFFREGAVLGREIAEISVKNRDEYFQTATRLLKARGWVEELEFKDDMAVASGSFEALPGKKNPGCHRLKGIVRELFEQYHHQKVQCVETECASTGKERCIFKMTRLGE